MFHGSLVLLAGFIGGFLFARAIKHAEREVAWRIVHSGSSMAGVMLIALAPVAPQLALPTWALYGLTWSLIIGVEAFVLGMYVAAFSGSRGLTRRGAANRAVFPLYALGIGLSMVGALALLVGAAIS